MIKFSIILVTYNRHELLRHTLASLALQTYKNFKVILIDNGSEIPVDTKTFPAELDIVFFRSEKNDRNIANDVFNKLHGTHFSMIADDDVWTSDTLKIVADIFRENSEVKSLGVGFSRYDLVNNRSLHDKEYFKAFSGRLEQFDAFNAGIAYCSYWFIGPNVNYWLPRMGHPSASFFTKELLDRTISKQGKIFLRPIGDVGYVGCCFHTKNIYYLDLPLVVLGEGHTKDMHGSLPGQRMKWVREVPNLEFSPLKGCSFINMAVETHLKVLYRNGINKLWDCTLRSDFYLQHLEQVITDTPWTETTERDIEETLPFAIAAFQRENNYKYKIRQIEIELRKWIAVKRNAQKGIK